MSANELSDLMNQGIAAARAGDRAGARAAFERVVELDEANEKAWFWLASVLDDDTQKRLALNTVLHLNPQNERARKALSLIEARQHTEETISDEVIPGVSRRTLSFLIAGAALIIIVLLAVLLIVGINNNTTAANANGTATAVQQVIVDLQNTQSAEQIALQQTEAAGTPTRSLQEMAATLPPTFTPTAAPTVPPTAEPLPFPTGLAGRLAVWAGRDFDVNGYLPVGTLSLSDGSFSRIGDEEGIDVALSDGGDKIVYTRFQPAVFSTLIEVININGTSPIALEATSLFDPKMPDFSPDGTQVVFVAREANEPTDHVYLAPIPTDTEGGFAQGGVAPQRVTPDDASYTDPAFSPDGQRLVVIRDNVNGSDAGADIVVLDVASGSLFPLTNDRDAYIESTPSWSPDGLQVVYAAAAATEPGNHDIAVRYAAGSSSVDLIARHPADDIRPAFSPDGRYIAFSSNRGGSYDVYVYDQMSQELFQLTNTPNEDEFVGSWR
ncbi:MAG: PD40 domain-containing protein [Anaerolineae bacterium]|nr:PD40 domain-containing protein [Anaerolineae bacterium]